MQVRCTLASVSNSLLKSKSRLFGLLVPVFIELEYKAEKIV